MLHHFIQKSAIPASAEAVFSWHEQADAFLKLTPPWEKVKVLEQTGPISEPGSRVVIEVVLWGPIRKKWISVHQNYKPGRQFQDIQISGPFKRWEHTHRVIPQTKTQCILEDSILYELPLSPLGDCFTGWFVENKLRRMFEFRHKVVLDDFIKGF